LAASCILIAVTPDTSLAQKRFALVIGNSDYASAVGGTLTNPVKDSNLVDTALRQIRFETIVKDNATRVDIKRERAGPANLHRTISGVSA
jgi:hypothetical protein